MASSATLTCVSECSEFSRSAALNQSQDTTVSDGNRIAEMKKVIRSMLTKAVCNGWHKPLRNPKEVVDDFATIDSGRVRKMKVEHRGLQATVP